MSNAEELPIAEDDRLSPAEKEVTFATTKAGEEFIVHSDVRSVTAWLIKHPAVEIVARNEHEGAIVGVTAHVPRALVDLKPKPRNTNQFGRMLSSSTLREADDEPQRPVALYMSRRPPLASSERPVPGRDHTDCKRYYCRSCGRGYDEIHDLKRDTVVS